MPADTATWGDFASKRKNPFESSNIDRAIDKRLGSRIKFVVRKIEAVCNVTYNSRANHVSSRAAKSINM